MSEFDPIPDLQPAPVRTEPRMYSGWVLMWIVLGIMFLGALLTYFDRKKVNTYTPDQASNVLYENLESPDRPDWMASPKEREQRINAALNGLQSDSTKDAQAAWVATASRFEIGEPLSESDLATMEASPKADVKAAAAIYRAEKLSTDQVAKLTKALADGTKLHKIAIAHARKKAGLGPEAAVEVSPGMLILSALLFLFFIAGIAVIILFGVRRSQSKWAPVGFPGRPLSRHDGDRYASLAGLFFAIMLLSSIGIGIVGDSIRPELRSLLTMVFAAILMLALLALPVNGKVLGFARVGLGKPNWKMVLGWTAGGYVANIALFIVTLPLVLILNRWLPNAEHPMTMQVTTAGSPWVIAALMAVAVIGAPIIEELIFRGSMLQAFGAGTKPWIAILLCGFIFAAIHPTGIPAWPALMAVGSVAGFLVYQTGSLYPAIFLHALHNLTVFSVTLLQR